MADHCVSNASRRAFLFRNDAAPPRVALTERCLTERGVYCESCRDACETGALRFVAQIGAVPKPLFAADLCTQCGDCARVCPQDAIKVRPKAVAHG
jgi:ferredoxin-type protein NapF